MKVYKHCSTFTKTLSVQNVLSTDRSTECSVDRSINVNIKFSKIVPQWTMSDRGWHINVLSSVQDIFRRIFLSNGWWQKSDIWSQAAYMYAMLWVAFLDLSDSYFLFVDLVGFYTHCTYMHIFRHIFLSNYW